MSTPELQGSDGPHVRGANLVLARIQALDLRIWQTPTWALLAILIALSFLRTGFVIWNWFYLSPHLLDSWSNPGNAFQSNVLFNALGTAWLHLVGSPDSLLWLTIQVLATVLGIFAICLLLLKRTRADLGFLPVALLLTSGVISVLWREIGRYDLIFILLICVALLVDRPWLRVSALALAAISAPEQAMLASIGVLGLSLLPMFSGYRRIGIQFLAWSTVAIVAVQLWFAVLGEPFKTRLGLSFSFLSGEKIEAPSRFDATQGFLATTLQKFYEGLAAGPALLWSYCGAILFVIVLVLVAQRRVWQGFVLIFFVIAFPLFTTLLFGEDPTRDLAIVGAPMLIMILVVSAPTLSDGLRRLPGKFSTWITALCLATCLLPMTYFFIYSESAFNFAVHLLISWNNGTPIDWSGNHR